MRSFMLPVVALLMLAFATVAVQAVDPPSADSAKTELVALGKLIEEAATKWRDAVQKVNAAADFNTVLDVSRKTSPMALHGERLIVFAKRHPGTNEALCALVHVVAYADNDPADPGFHYAEEAIDLLKQNELHDEIFPVAVSDLTSSISPRAEATLRHVSEHSDNRLVRASATYGLVEYLHRLSREVRSIDEEPTGTNRDWVKQAYRPALIKKLAKRTPDQLVHEMTILAERLQREYGDFKQPETRYSGPDRIIRELAERDKPLTYGDIADAFLFEMRHLQVGQRAPEIIGKDTQGREFRLSDYRKKVIVLTFSSVTCGPCVADYPLNRKLVERYKDRPFALLSVVADEESRTVDEAIAKGDITWRCWYDGLDGPIARRWNIQSHGWPTVFIIDAQCVIRHRDPTDEKINQLVEELVGKAEKSHE